MVTMAFMAMWLMRESERAQDELVRREGQRAKVPASFEQAWAPCCKPMPEGGGLVCQNGCRIQFGPQR